MIKNRGDSTSADVVVIGGGILGACAALHLHEAGAEQVVLLDREAQLGSQTTAAGAGFVSSWVGGTEAELAPYAMDFYERLQAEQGEDVGVRKLGLLYPALSEAGMDMLKEKVDLEADFAGDAALVDADEASRLSPLLARGAVHGGLFYADARKVPTHRVIRALRRRLAEVGAEIRCGVEAVRAVDQNGRVVGVETDEGVIPAGTVVNAAGVAARQLAARNGIELAMAPLLESRSTTESLPQLPAEHPMLLFLEEDLFYVRPEDGGLLLGAIESDLPAVPEYSSTNPPRATELTEDVAEAHERHARRLEAVMPDLARVRFKARASGLPTWTPDGLHLLGPVTGLEGYFVLAGCNEFGVTHGPGLGRLLAELVVTGTTPPNVSRYRVERFPSMSSEELHLAARAQYLARHPAGPWRLGEALDLEGEDHAEQPA
jgi:sarcosine oxidase, subunit beta